MSAPELAHAAEALLGTRYRLHGRDPATGLDCVGLLAAALTAIGRPAPLPTGYALRSRALPHLERTVSACGFAGVSGPCEPGDVLMTRPAPCQFHLLIAGTSGCLIHAHAGLRRVVAVPFPCPWPILHHWRLLRS